MDNLRQRWTICLKDLSLTSGACIVYKLRRGDSLLQGHSLSKYLFFHVIHGNCFKLFDINVSCLVTKNYIVKKNFVDRTALISFSKIFQGAVAFPSWVVLQKLSQSF